jgi:hypothetical protein
MDLQKHLYVLTQRVPLTNIEIVLIFIKRSKIEYFTSKNRYIIR